MTKASQTLGGRLADDLCMSCARGELDACYLLTIPLRSGPPSLPASR